MLFRLSYLGSNFAQSLGYLSPASKNPALNDLNWHSPELRHKIARLTTMYKIANNIIRVNIPEYIAARSTRVTRSCHSSNILVTAICTYRYNFFTRTLKEWDTYFLIDQPFVEAFKSAVTNY